MEKIAIIAGNGNLPYFFYEIAKKKGHDVYVIGLFDTVNEKLKETPNYVQMNIGEIGKLIGYLILNNIEKITMLGKVEKSLIFQNLKLDDTFKMIISGLPDIKDETVIFAVINALKESGIEVLPQNFLIDDLYAVEKLYTTNIAPDENDEITIKMGIEAAKALSRVDVGQTVVLKNRAVVALEAVEGTDETIKRAYNYAGKGCIIVKMARPQQDMRVDVPTIGIDTINNMIEINAKGIVIEAEKIIFLNQEEVIKKAEENNIFIKGIKVI
ncbi:MAG: UDP-2,3-diacylglucosamine diphosphatase LpxI [Fusobacteria bacterium]|nr:UDP-2,3-diacylglucosamine diphosphatase LpxI [Fusobacteriota bacterium]